ncbi:MAG: asparagine synthase (glutamine-hydrolyzing) [Chitinophagaceae bacterium]|nr:asparagine synthase (glutamine-hydrolyzing) [Chitinophagaceae bacterium]
MCGIAGIIQADLSSYSKEHLKKMTDALAHRGPDGAGLWQNESGHVLLGHRRLSIIDMSDAGHQPMHLNPCPSPQGEERLGVRYSIIHNGEIYNYIELKEELKKKGYHFHSQTDTEVIIAAYDCWQEDCVDHFDGMFAFAIWDEKEKELFAARDRFGEKPFFYHFNGTQLVFASEMKALWAAGIDRVPNQKMLFNFITIGYTDNPEHPGETFFENIYKLPPATTLTYHAREKKLMLQKFWDIDPDKQNKTITDNEAIEQFTHLFTTSIKRRLRSDVSIGTSLSGGLDSSSIVSQINDLQTINYKTQTFTALFPGFEKDEGNYSKQVASLYQLKQFNINVTAEEMLTDWEKLCYHQEEPFGSASIYAQYKVYELAKQHNITVLLDGQGADETLAGYHKYYKWYWQELFRNRKLFRSKELKAARQMGIPDRFGIKNMIAAYFPGFATVTLENQYLLKAIRQEDLDRDFVKLQSKEAYYTTPDHYTLNGVLHFSTCIHGLEELLRYADRNSMAHGREVRLPFLSHELVEFIFSLPANFKIRNGWSKWLLRETMKNKLPDSIVWRRDKVGFEPPQKSWMENKQVQDALREARKKLVDEKVLKPEVLQKKIQPHAAYEADNYDWRYFSAASLFK